MLKVEVLDAEHILDMEFLGSQLLNGHAYGVEGFLVHVDHETFLVVEDHVDHHRLEDSLIAQHGILDLYLA